MIRWFKSWRTRRRQRMCDLVAEIWAECEAELAEEIERSKWDMYGNAYFTKDGKRLDPAKVRVVDDGGGRRYEMEAEEENDA